MNYSCVCFYTLLFALEINARLANFGNFVSVFKNSYFPFFFFFKFLCNFWNFVYEFGKEERNKIWHTQQLKIKYFHFPWMLNGENQSVNTSEIGFRMWLIVKKWSGEKNAPEGGRGPKNWLMSHIFLSA